MLLPRAAWPWTLVTLRRAGQGGRGRGWTRGADHCLRHAPRKRRQLMRWAPCHPCRRRLQFLLLRRADDAAEAATDPRQSESAQRLIRVSLARPTSLLSSPFPALSNRPRCPPPLSPPPRCANPAEQLPGGGPHAYHRHRRQRASSATSPPCRPAGAGCRLAARAV